MGTPGFFLVQIIIGLNGDWRLQGELDATL